MKADTKRRMQAVAGCIAAAAIALSSVSPMAVAEAANGTSGQNDAAGMVLDGLSGQISSYWPGDSNQAEARVHLDPNGAAAGEMDDLTAAISVQDPQWTIEIPANAFVRQGYRFCGWSTSPTGEDVADDPSTEADEARKAVSVPDSAAIEGWSCVRDAEGTQIDADLSSCVQEGTLTLYAQWAPLSQPGDALPASTETEAASDDATAQDEARSASESTASGEAAERASEQDAADAAAGADEETAEAATIMASTSDPVSNTASGQSPGASTLASTLSAKSGTSLSASALLASASTDSSGSDVSSHAHMTITSNKSTYEAGAMALVTFEYTIDTGSANPGDYVLITIPTEIAESVSITPDPRMFSSVVDMGNGTYKLVFGENAQRSLAGGFTAYITTKNVTEVTPGTITSGTASLPITVIPTGSADGTSTTYTDAIMKGAYANSSVKYGGYDYSEGSGNSAAQIGIDESLGTSDQTLKYRIYINDKRATMNGITVVDTLPDGMVFDTTQTLAVLWFDSQEAIDPSEYTIALSGNTLTFSYPGTITTPIQINYWVVAGHGSVKYTNRADITYTSGGQSYQEHRNYVLQSGSYKSAFGEKSVDKTAVSNDPADQMVTYTIKFWNYDGFKVGDINFDDTLDAHVTYLYAVSNDKFKVEYDDTTHSVHIENTSAITGDDTEYVRFVVDFTNVPSGYTVVNTVGGNTVKTLKEASISLAATKTVNGAAPGESLAGKFSFDLKDADGTILQTKQADATGAVAFGRIEYGQNDVGKTFTYTVSESALADDLSSTYEKDASIYTVTVTPALATDADGNQYISAVPTIAKDGASASSIEFNNTSKTGSLEISKAVAGTTTAEDGHAFPMKVVLEKDGAALAGTYPYQVLDGTGTVLSSGTLASGDALSIEAGQKAEVSGIPAGTSYTVSEPGMPSGGFTQTASSGTTGTIEAGAAAAASFTNTYDAQGSFTPTATKTLTGASLQDGEFTFLLKDSEGNTIQTATNKADGSITFDAIAYHLADLDGAASKDFTYTISEQDDSASMPHYSFDTSTKTLKVHIEDAGDGTLTASVTEGDAVPAFTNTYALGLPKAGGAGLAATAFCGLALVAVCAAWLARRNGPDGSSRNTKGGEAK